jgi:predicted DNA-binding ribbon-helix-helix protein
MKANDKDSIAKSLKALQAENEGDPTWTFGRGAEGRANALAFTRAVRGRPPKGSKAIGTSTRSLRFTKDVWNNLEAEATRRKITLHALLRVIVAEFLFTRPTHEAAAREPIASRTAAGKRTRKSG